MNKHLRKSAMTLAATALIGAVAVGGSLAYLTDNETATNVFTVGKVQADLEEPGYTEPNHALVPNEEVTKDPQIENTGISDEIVFMSVTVPTSAVTVVSDNGESASAKTMQDLFWFKQADDGASTHANNWDTSKWVLLGEYLDGDSSSLTETVTMLPSTTSHTYVFGYNEAITKDQKTDPLFDKVQLKNFIEGEYEDANKAKAANIDVKAYAIQGSNILESDTDISGTLDKTNLTKIYNIYLDQRTQTSQADKAANTNNAKDLKGTDR